MQRGEEARVYLMHRGAEEVCLSQKHVALTMIILVSDLVKGTSCATLVSVSALRCGKNLSSFLLVSRVQIRATVFRLL